jgi:hypothetical protein
MAVKEHVDEDVAEDFGGKTIYTSIYILTKY